ncbi:MAG: dipeptide/oligopeptide/nickel ABC transporter ATP-binding protein [Lachnospiraceae bacterium]
MDGHFVEVSHLRQYFLAGGWGKGRTYSRAVEDLSFYIDRGETLGLVGASGCGKTTVARTLLRLYEPMGGRFVFDGQVIFDVKNRQYAPMFPIRKRMQLVFQDPYASLNPRMTVGDIVGEGMDVHKMAGDKRKRQEQIMGMLELVKLDKSYVNRYPHELSGGQRQRVGIARALMVHPDFLICDEPVSALDMSVQTQILELFRELQEKCRLTCLFISHDLSAVRQVAGRIAVMREGRIVDMLE